MDSYSNISLHKGDINYHKADIVMMIDYNLHSLIHKDNILDCRQYLYCKLAHMKNRFINCKWVYIFGIELMKCIMNIVMGIIDKLLSSLIL